MPGFPSLIYIASTGRSGSTILEMLLNTVERVWSMGEIYTLPWEVRRNGKCGCGRKIPECEFWSRILHPGGLLPADAHELSKFRETASGGKFFRPIHLLNIFFRTGWFTGGDTDMFCRENSRLFETIREQAQEIKSPVDYLVDASKDFYRLDWLSRCPGIPMKVIHIVKDPRAYVYSIMKSEPATGAAGNLQCFRMAIKYLLENAIIEHIMARLPESDRYFVRYEDLAVRPGTVISDIAGWIGIPADTRRITDFREAETHAIAGNSARQAAVGISLDKAWKQNLIPRHKWIVRMVTWKTGRRYGYYRAGGLDE